MKKVFLCLVCALMCVCVLSGCDKKPGEKYNVVISVEDYGDIKLELDSTYAPITVKNFIDLVNDGFYDGLTFHRADKGFVLQGGDPDGTGNGGSDKTIRGEFLSNGHVNKLSHTRGVISMARRGDSYDSATSQFFIVLNDSAASSLDGNYASFGKVTEGMEIVDKIVEDAEPIDGMGLLEKSKQPKITSIKVVD